MSKPKWLSEAVFYEIYPQSFYDSNNDGIGDICGIIEKLDYVKSLGCNAIWLNPCFESPFYDAGYDVSDYYKVAARYGTNADMKKLFNAASKMGIRVCLDLVPGHTSIEHKWFKASCSPEKNEYTNRYIWTDNVWDGETGSLAAINGFADRDGRYITNFFWSQPALNYGFAKPEKGKPWQLDVDHPDVLATREELKRIICFWLDMGAAGFRVDMASSLVKNDKGHKQTTALWRDVRKTLDEKYPEAVLISEWGNPASAIKAGFHIDFMLHFNDPAYTSLFRQELFRDCFKLKKSVAGTPYGASVFDEKGQGDISAFMDSFLAHYKSVGKKGYISIPSGNHDISRLNTKRSEQEMKIAMAFLLTQPGVPFIYYGDEIGMRYIKDLPSKEGGYGRTGSRTPMQWSNRKNKGFSNAAQKKLYLPVDSDKDAPTVADQDKDKNSLLNTVRELIAMRQHSKAFKADGDFEIVYIKPKSYPFVYMRKKGAERYIVAVNPSGNETQASFNLKAKSADVVMGNEIAMEIIAGKASISMPPLSFAIFRLSGRPA